MKAAQKSLDAWVVDYNTNRPHQALEMATPAERFRPNPPPGKNGTLLPVDSAEDKAGQWVLRRIGSNGAVSIDSRVIFVGNQYKNLIADVFADGSVVQIWYQNHLIKTVARTRTGRIRKVRSDGLHVEDHPKPKRKASGEP